MHATYLEPSLEFYYSELKNHMNSWYLWTSACISKFKPTHLKRKQAFSSSKCLTVKSMPTMLCLPVETYLIKKIRPVCSCCSHKFILPARMILHIWADIINKPCIKARRNNIQMNFLKIIKPINIRSNKSLPTFHLGVHFIKVSWAVKSEITLLLQAS